MILGWSLPQRAFRNHPPCDERSDAGPAHQINLLSERDTVKGLLAAHLVDITSMLCALFQ
ncbi:MAG: hypothetical protein ACYCOU_01655 [Sulfobacillus sp.]